MRLAFGNHHYTPYRHAWEDAVNNPNLGVDGNNKTQTYITLGSIPHRRLLLPGYLADAWFWAAAARAPPIWHASKWERIAHLLIIMLYHGGLALRFERRRTHWKKLAEQRLWSNGMRWWHCELLLLQYIVVSSWVSQEEEVAEVSAIGTSSCGKWSRECALVVFNPLRWTNDAGYIQQCSPGQRNP